MSDALLSSLHEFWMQNSEYVTGDMLCAIFGPSCAQTKLISDPKGPVVYLNAEAGETAQQVFQYILERAVAFVNDARPVDTEGVSVFLGSHHATPRHATLILCHHSCVAFPVLIALKSVSCKTNSFCQSLTHCLSKLYCAWVRRDPSKQLLSRTKRQSKNLRPCAPKRKLKKRQRVSVSSIFNEQYPERRKQRLLPRRGTHVMNCTTGSTNDVQKKTKKT